MKFALAMISGAFIGLMAGILIASGNTDVKWSDAAGAISTAIASIGTVATLAYAVHQNAANRREIAVQKLFMDRAQLELLIPLLDDVVVETMRHRMDTIFSKSLNSWSFPTEPERLEGLRDRLRSAVQHTSLPAGRGVCDRVRYCLEELSIIPTVARDLSRIGSEYAIQARLESAVKIAKQQCKTAGDLHFDLTKQLISRGAMPSHQ